MPKRRPRRLPPCCAAVSKRSWLARHCEGKSAALQSQLQPAKPGAILMECPAHLLQKSIALPDVHSGYGFAIGNVAAFDMADPESIVSPGGVGFDINCGVRLIRTNLVSNHHASHLIESSVDDFRIVMFVNLDILRLARCGCRRCFLSDALHVKSQQRSTHADM